MIANPPGRFVIRLRFRFLIMSQYKAGFASGTIWGEMRIPSIAKTTCGT